MDHNCALMYNPRVYSRRGANSRSRQRGAIKGFGKSSSLPIMGRPGSFFALSRSQKSADNLKTGADKGDPQVPGCIPDFRQKSSSFDLHQIGSSAMKMRLLTKLFRSKSDGAMKKKSKDTSPPAGSTGQRRRFVRVIKNEESVGEEYQNPHVVRKYEQGYWEKAQIRKAQSLDECSNRPLPYQVSGHTILKKHGSMDNDVASGSESGSPTAVTKHASFKDDVEVLEFDIKEKCLHIHSCRESGVIHERLHDDDMIDVSCLFDPSEIEINTTSLESISETEGSSQSSSASSSELNTPENESVSLEELCSRSTVPNVTTSAKVDSVTIQSYTIQQCCDKIENLNTDLSLDDTETPSLPKITDNNTSEPTTPTVIAKESILSAETQDITSATDCSRQ